MESHIQNKQRLIWTHGHVLWTYQLTGYISGIYDTIEDHESIVQEVLCILQENNLYLKPEKCNFKMDYIDYLRIIVGNGTVWMDPKKVAVLNTWPTPLKKCNVQSFLGFCNFFRCFIQGFSPIAWPLSQLTGNSEWSWGDKEQLAFEELKHWIVLQTWISYFFSFSFTFLSHFPYKEAARYDSNWALKLILSILLHVLFIVSPLHFA